MWYDPLLLLQMTTLCGLCGLKDVKCTVSADFRVRAAFFDPPLFGVPFPLPTPQGRLNRQLRDIPKIEIRGLH